MIGIWIRLTILYFVDNLIIYLLMRGLFERKQTGWWWTVLALVVPTAFSMINCIVCTEYNRELYLWSGGAELICAVASGFMYLLVFRVKAVLSLGITQFFFYFFYMLDFLGVLLLGMALQLPDLGIRVLSQMGYEHALYFGVLRGVEMTGAIIWGRRVHKEVREEICQQAWPFYVLAAFAWFSTIQIMLIRMEEYGTDIWLYSGFIGIIVLVTILFVLAWNIYRDISEREKNTKLQNRLLMEGFQRTEREFQANREIFHDLKHQLYYTKMLLEEDKAEEAKEYLNKVGGDVQKHRLDDYCTNSTVNALLNSKFQEAQERHIEVITETDCFDCADRDASLCLILANLLDNAMEAAVQAIPARIYFFSKKDEDSVRITIQNTFAEIPTVRNGRFVSHKKDARLHGYGIENVKRIVRQEGWFIDFSFTSEIFTVDLLVTEGMV